MFMDCYKAWILYELKLLGASVLVIQQRVY